MTESFFDAHAFQKGDRVILPDGANEEIAQIDFEYRQIKVFLPIGRIVSKLFMQ
jgi:hypothetical protein